MDFLSTLLEELEGHLVAGGK